MKLVYIDSCDTVKEGDVVHIFKRPCVVIDVPSDNTVYPFVQRMDETREVFSANPTWFGAMWYTFKK